MVGAWTIFLQTVLSFVVLLVLTRILGKQQVSQLTFYEYLNGITFGSIAANMATIELEKVPDHIIGLITYGILTLAVSWLAVKNRKFRKLVAGEPVIVIQNGHILESNMRKMNLDLDELTTMLRSQGVFDYKELELGIVEQSGELSVLKKPEYQEVTQGDMNLQTVSKGLAVEVIVDGQIIYENLRSMGLDGKWLMQKLKEAQIYRIADVCFATVNAKHELQFDLYADNLPGMMDISEEDTSALSLDHIQIKPDDERDNTLL